jgi:hypothetical protein
MIESPLLQEIEKQARVQVTREIILDILAGRFGAVEEDVSIRIGRLRSERKLRALVIPAVRCSDLNAFRERLRTGHCRLTIGRSRKES